MSEKKPQDLLEVFPAIIDLEPGALVLYFLRPLYLPTETMKMVVVKSKHEIRLLELL